MSSVGGDGETTELLPCCHHFNIIKTMKGICPFNIVLGVDFTPNSRALVVSVKAGLMSYSLITNEVLWEAGGNRDNRYDSYGMVQHPDGSKFATLFEGTCEMRSGASGKVTSNLSGDDSGYMGAGYTTDGELVLFESYEPDDASSGCLRFFPSRAELRNVSCNVGPLPISSQNMLVASDLDEDGGTRTSVWDLQQRTRICDVPFSCTRDAVWNSDGTMIAARGDDSLSLQVFRFSYLTENRDVERTDTSDTGRPFFTKVAEVTVAPTVSVFCFIPKTNKIVIYADGLKVWDVESDRPPRDIPDTRVPAFVEFYQITFSPDGMWLAAHGEEDIYIWNWGRLFYATTCLAALLLQSNSPSWEELLQAMGGRAKEPKKMLIEPENEKDGRCSGQAAENQNSGPVLDIEANPPGVSGGDCKRRKLDTSNNK